MRSIIIGIVAVVLAQGGDPPLPPFGRMVDVGGYRVHLNCTGSGSPAVILESGGGSFSFDWSLAQPGIARTTMVCSHDRANHAWSDPAPGGTTLDKTVEELHRLLEKGGVPPPYVLVGHSWGGAIVRVFADRYRASVAGLVLVDVAHEDQTFVLDGQRYRLRDLSTPEEIAIYARFREGLARNVPPDRRALSPPFDRLPPDVQRVRDWAAPRMDLWEGIDAREGMVLLHATRHGRAFPLDPLPLVVVTRAHAAFPAQRELTDDEVRWRLLQDDLARLSHNSRHVMATASAHFIQIYQPETVVAAIDSVVQAARSGKPLSHDDR